MPQKGQRKTYEKENKAETKSVLFTLNAMRGDQNGVEMDCISLRVSKMANKSNVNFIFLWNKPSFDNIFVWIYNNNNSVINNLLQILYETKYL